MTIQDGKEKKEKDYITYLKDNNFTCNPLQEDKYFKDITYREGDLYNGVKKIRVYINLTEGIIFFYDMDGRKTDVPEWLKEKVKIIAMKAMAMVDEKQMMFDI